MQFRTYKEIPGLILPVLRVDEHECPYVEGRRAAEMIVVDPAIEGPLYQTLMDRGFRRSGDMFYRPDCPDCRACVPIRVPVADFEPSKSQRRVAKRNADVAIDVNPPTIDGERIDLYRRYQFAQHDGTMDFDAETYEQVFCRAAVDVIEMTYRVDGRLIGVGILDATPSALSSVYFYFDPAEHRRSLGTFSALTEIAECRARGLPYWYMGFHVAGCDKMEYKRSFRPYQLLGADGKWSEPLDIPPHEPLDPMLQQRCRDSEPRCPQPG